MSGFPTSDELRGFRERIRAARGTGIVPAFGNGAKVDRHHSEVEAAYSDRARMMTIIDDLLSAIRQMEAHEAALSDSLNQFAADNGQVLVGDILTVADKFIMVNVNGLSCRVNCIGAMGRLIPGMKVAVSTMMTDNPVVFAGVDKLIILPRNYSE